MADMASGSRPGKRQRVSSVRRSSSLPSDDEEDLKTLLPTGTLFEVSNEPVEIPPREL